MPERAGQNPYARPVSRNDGSAPNPSGEFRWGGPGRYAVPNVPESTDPTYVDGAYATELAAGGSPTGTPDDIRIGTREPPPNSPQDKRWYIRRVSEFYKRIQDERTVTGWRVQQRRVPPPRVPLWEQERPPTRPSATFAPMPYLFTRPEHRPRNISEAIGPNAVQHLSMADHRRTYPIMGQKPQGRLGVNTYRAPVRPWDENNYVPPQPPNSSNGVFGNGAHRLV